MRLIAILWLIIAAVCHASRMVQLVKVVLLIGDDPVEGYASVSHLKQLAQESPHYQHWLVNNATWTVLDRVYCSYDHFRADDWLHGPVTVTGFGSTTDTKFGPEVEMGHILQQAWQDAEWILIIKAAWSHRTLYKDFRPPSSDRPGFQWYRIHSSIERTIANMHEVIPISAKHRVVYAPDIVGAVWWHGYSDLKSKDNAFAVQEYEDNLIHFIKDLRKETKRPNLPVIIGELGGQGPRTSDHEELEFRAMQRRVASRLEFHENVRVVPTSPLVDVDAPPMGDVTHYYGRADTMIQIGQAFALALVEMVPTMQQQREAFLAAQARTQLPTVFLACLVILLGISAAIGLFLATSGQKARKKASKMAKRVKRSFESTPLGSTIHVETPDLRSEQGLELPERPQHSDKT